MLSFLLLPLFALFSLFTTDGGSGDSGDGDDDDSAQTGASKDDDSGANAGGSGGGDKDGKGGDGFSPITSQADFDARIQSRLAQQERTLRKSVAETVKAELKADADATAAKEQGNFKALYEAEQVKRETLERDLETRDRADLVRRVAEKHKLPAAMAKRLTGETEADLDADAKDLAKLITTDRVVDTETGSGAGGGTGSRGNRQGRKSTENGETPRYSFIPEGAVTIPD